MKGDFKPVTPQETMDMDQLRNLDQKIAQAIKRVKVLKDEKSALEARVRELESRVAELDDTLRQRDHDLRDLQTEKGEVRSQIQDLLNELESIEE
jgi:septal ring factor EnvC (AmiA/AmiB activator)